MGIDVAMSFFNVPSAYNNGVLPPLAVASTPAAVMQGTMYSGPNKPNEVMMTGSLVSQCLFKAVFPESYRFFEYGNSDPAAGVPMPGEVNIGKCLTSVHAAQLPGSLIQ